jgi:ketosteroid isomerase-like protein
MSLAGYLPGDVRGVHDPDPVELMRKSVEGFTRRDFDWLASFYAPDAVLESMGMATSFEGVVAIRGFFEDFISAYEEWELEPEEIVDLGNGVTFSVLQQSGRPLGSSGQVQMRFASVFVSAQRVFTRQIFYTGIDEGRAAAERLAESRG